MSRRPETEDPAAAIAATTWFERTDGSRLVMTGADCKDLLHRLTSNDILALVPGRGCRTLLLERSGRLVDRLIATDRGEDLLLLGTGVRAEPVIAAIERFTILEDSRIARLDGDDARDPRDGSGGRCGGGSGDAASRRAALDRYGCAPVKGRAGSARPWCAWRITRGPRSRS